MPKRELTPEEGRDIVFWNDENYEEIETSVTGTSRWLVHYKGIFKDIRDGTFWKTEWSEGATEYQPERPFQYDGTAEFYQVEPKEVTVVQYFMIEE